MKGHMEIGREDGDQQDDQSPASELTAAGKEHAQAAKHLARSADVDQFQMRRQVRWYDGCVPIRMDEVIGPGRYEKGREQDEANAFRD